MSDKKHQKTMPVLVFVFPVARIDYVAELNIGHSIISRAVLVGIERPVREMKELINS